MSLWQAKMPSNIALIKYMGKKDVDRNIPANHSISWTLDHLCTEVQVEVSNEVSDSWKPLVSEYPFELSAKGKEKYLGHAQRVKEALGIKENFVISSANSFPADCGIASSASSFAALTEALCIAGEALGGRKLSLNEKALLSARGSGSSCRSFLSGFVEWNEDSIAQHETPYEKLYHMVVLVGMGTKKVSSSDAHKRVSSSLLYDGRIDRTHKRMENLKQAFANKDWKSAYEISWAEFWDMHALFETSEPPFGYFLPESFKVLESARSLWQESGDGPIVTMDAGPNVHLLWREDQKDLAARYYQKFIKGHWRCLGLIDGVELV